MHSNAGKGWRMSFVINSYFSGAGLMDIGLLQAGINIQSAFELDADAVKTYAGQVILRTIRVFAAIMCL